MGAKTDLRRTLAGTDLSHVHQQILEVLECSGRVLTSQAGHWNTAGRAVMSGDRLLSHLSLDYFQYRRLRGFTEIKKHEVYPLFPYRMCVGYISEAECN